MRKDKLVKIVLSGLAFSFVVASLALLPACDDRESDPTRANVERQIRPLLEKALNVKLAEASMSTSYGSPEGSTKTRVVAVGTYYNVRGRLGDPSQIVNGLVSVVRSLGVEGLEAGTVSHTSIVIFKGLSIEGERWNGFIQVHRKTAGWYLQKL